MPEFINLTSTRSSSDELQDYLAKRKLEYKAISQTVSDIIADVRINGDDALRNYSLKFDSFIVDSKSIRVNNEEKEQAIKTINTDQKKPIEFAYDRIYKYHEQQVPFDKSWVDQEGVELGWKWSPIERCALYVPGGTAPLTSSVLMMGVPAQVANVPHKVMVVPPKHSLNPLILYAASLVGIDEIYKLGGSQAIAALAYGTASVKPVDKIFGPGNAYVSEAKRQVFGDVGIDMIAGPSEVVIICDENAHVAWIAADLIAQAEHDYLAKPIVIVTNEHVGMAIHNEVLNQTKQQPREEIITQSWHKHGCIISVNSINDAIEVANKIGPEHLQLAVNLPNRYIECIKNAGAVFLGEYTPESIGDYIAGPSHVLPTSGAAKYTSGLSVIDFFKRTSFIQTPAQALGRIGPAAIKMAQSEELIGHANAIQIRLNYLKYMNQ